jgi:hypothetical protein
MPIEHAAFEHLGDLAGSGHLGFGPGPGDPADREREATVLPVELAVPGVSLLLERGHDALPGATPRQPHPKAEKSQQDEFCQSERGYAGST